MEHKFGIFNTVEELNRAAAAQKAEGDTEAVVALALENGLEEADAEDYLDGAADVLATPLMAALGRLELEGKELGLQIQFEDWKGYVAGFCAESEEMCHAVFRPDKTLADMLAAALKQASQSRIRVPDALTKKAGLPNGTYMGMIGKAEFRKLAEKHYLEKGDGR